MMKLGERPLDYSKCARPGCDEDEGRIDNYCSVYCRDVDEAWLRVAQLEEFVRLVQVEWTVLESGEDVVRVEYPTDVHKKLKALGG